jgi:hypothetical protein
MIVAAARLIGTIRTTRVPARTGAQSQRSVRSVTLMVRQEITAKAARMATLHGAP